MTGGHSHQGKLMIFRQFAIVAGCVRSFMLAQKMQAQNF